MPAYPLFLLLGAVSALFVGMIDPIIAVYYVQVVGLGPLQLVLLGTVVEVSQLLFEVPTGVVADLYSRRLSVIIGVLLVGACFVVQGLVPVVAAIALAEVLRGIGATFNSGALEAWIADEIGEDRAAGAYLRYAQTRQLGALAGTVAGVALAGVALGLPVLIGGVGMLVLGVFLVFAMPERNFVSSRQDDREGAGGGPEGAPPRRRRRLGGLRDAAATFLRGLDEVRSRPLLGTLMALWLVFALSTEGLDRLWEAHLLTGFQFPTAGGFSPVFWFGAINVAFMLLSVGANEVARRRVDLTDDAAVARSLFLISVLRIAGVVLFGLTVGFGLAVFGYITTEVMRRVTQPLFVGWVNRHVEPRTRATLLSMGGTVDAIGQLTGGPMIGLVGQLLSLRAAMVAVGLTLVPALPLLNRARRQAEQGAGQKAV
ncbi:MAG TPA: MFS transporter [Chloroflexota bacterium]|nr:MFS transporter [Chloroflexota bacterium]